MNAILVAVNYTNLLKLTLPYNRHHFDKVMVVTDANSSEDVYEIADQCRAEVHVTDAFYRGGAHFNKWLALEEGLDVLGRSGWICVMDADVLWPRETLLNWDPLFRMGWTPLQGRLYTPRRRMLPTIPQEVPPEETWKTYPLYQSEEFAGWTQIFHASDPVLGPAPWYETNWIHAGGADTFFQSKWPKERKIRPPFEVLHLGPNGKNWCGVGNEKTLHHLMMKRRVGGQRGGDKYGHEKLS